MFMTPVDLHVKESMLEYASIFPTRLKVLEHDFFVLGNGKDWLEDGTLGSRYRESKELGEGVIYTADLDKFITDAQAYLDKYGHDHDRASLAKYQAERAERLERAANIDLHATYVNPTGEIKGGHYGQLENILADLFRENYTGKPYLKIWNIPANVEASWWSAACEAMEAAIRGSHCLDDREYARLCWKAMTDFVEGRAAAFVVPAKPETRAERAAREDIRIAKRRAAFDQIKLIERVLKRAGYAGYDMKSRRRAEVDMSNGTYHMSVYRPCVLTPEIIAKIDRAMVKQGYSRTDDEKPTWENGEEHRVALRLFPFAFEGLYEARILVVGSPEDKDSKDAKHRAWYAAAQTKFDYADARGRYAVIMAGFHPNSGLNM